MKIKLTSVYVDNQDNALRFYTDVLGFAVKADFSNGPFRWLTVISPDEPEGAELQLALNDNPAAKAYQQAIFKQGQPALMLLPTTSRVITSASRDAAVRSPWRRQK
ncbi:VOC family protein [Mesorhizobium sp. M0761]|uniref:VOC family protein n=1 Tax=Mesorhizobium sp. M0761 TaxID=2956994 RepID=UPI003335FA5A